MSALAAALLLAAPLLAAPDDALERALRAELARSGSALKQEGYPAPYYVRLTATELESREERCLMGGETFTGGFSQRVITPDLHVGSPELDNHPISPSGVFVGSSLPMGENEFAIRHELWRDIDTAYKGATAAFLRKQALRVSRGKAEYDTDDLAPEAPHARLLTRPASPWRPEDITRLCREGSAALSAMPELLSATAATRLRRQWTRIRDSKGARVDTGRDFAEVELEGVALSTDGLRLFAQRHYVTSTPGALPTPEEIRAAAGGLLEDLRALRAAKSTSPFSAPALFDPSVGAAVVLSIASRLSGEEQRNPSGAQTFRDKMGKRVLPEELSLEDDPRLESFGGKPLVGHYDYDDEGVPAARASLVEKGVLRGLLLSRYPVIGFPRSNGHGRASPGYIPDGSPGVLRLVTSRPRTPEALLEGLRAECRRRGKPYGLWVRRLRGFAQNQRTGGQVSLRLLPGLLYLVDAKTGALTLVRDLDAVGTPLSLLGNVVAAGTDSEAHNFVISEAASVIVPSLLLSEVELQRAETRPERPPVLPPPSP